MLVRLRWVVALALALVCAWPPSLARADSGYWIPSSWVDVSVGGDVRALFGVGGLAVPAGEYGADVPEDALYSGDTGVSSAACVRTYEDVVATGANSASLYFSWVDGLGYSTDNSQSCSYSGSLSVLNPSGVQCLVTATGAFVAYNNVQFVRSYQSDRIAITSMGCPAGSVWYSITYPTVMGIYPQLGGTFYNAGAAEYLGAAEITTEVWCRSASGDEVVTETYTSGTSVPSPVCPSGAFPVRVRVTSTADGVLHDASITSSALEGYAEYLSSPGGWSFRLFEGGYPCIPGDPSCVAALEGTWDEDLHECVLQGPGGQWVPVDASVCQDAWDEARPVIPGSTAGDDDPAPETVDAESIVRAVQRAASDIVSGVKRAIDASVAGVKAGIAVIQSQLDGTNTRLDDLGQAVRDLPAEIAESVADGIASIFQPGQATADSLNGIVAAMGAKFGPWRDVGVDLMMGFGEPCQCAVWHLDLPGLKERLVLFNSCAGYGLVMATAGRVGTTAVIYVSTVAMCVKFVAGSVSYVSFLK